MKMYVFSLLMLLGTMSYAQTDAQPSKAEARNIVLLEFVPIRSQAFPDVFQTTQNAAAVKEKVRLWLNASNETVPENETFTVMRRNYMALAPEKQAEFKRVVNWAKAIFEDLPLHNKMRGEQLPISTRDLILIQQLLRP